MFFDRTEFPDLIGNREAFVRAIFKDLMVLFRTEMVGDGSCKVYWGSDFFATAVFLDDNRIKLTFENTGCGRAIDGCVKARYPNKD